MRLMVLVVALSCAHAVVSPRIGHACTSILVSKGASADGSTFVTYAADSHVLYGNLPYRPATQNGPDAMVDIMDWDSGKFLGRIKQAPKTYAVVGHMNEHQLVIGETTWGGREELKDPTGIMDYGSLIYVTLQRAATARDAIKIMTDLVAEYGYFSTGESFSIADGKEAWLLEMIGKGPGNKGAVWVAVKIPEGTISAHANQARIRQFPLNDKENCLYSPDVIRVARERGYFQGKDAQFSFTDAYSPMDGETLRTCEARVWSIFRRVAPSLKLSADYVKAVEGAMPLPLWVKPDRKVDAHDVMELMRDHFEGTDFDLSTGVGAGPYNLPYRWRPLKWDHEGQRYLNDRAISTQQTGFSIVGQSRSHLPAVIGGVLWFGLDDTASTVYMPMYASIRSIPRAVEVGNGTLHQFTWDSAFWTFNWVSNFAYSRYSDMIVDIRKVQRELEGDFLARQPEVEKTALKLHETSPDLARAHLTDYSAQQTERTVRTWRKLGEQLLVKYMDGNVKDELGNVLHPPYAKEWYGKIVREDPERYRVKKLKGEPEPYKPIPTQGYFHSRAELGPLAKEVPEDFPFATEKLLLVPGTTRCHAPPLCCVKAAPDAKGANMVISIPKGKPDKCGAPGWLVRLPKDETRPLVLNADGH